MAKKQLSETEQKAKAAKAAAKHKEMLHKIAEVRVPRVVAGILSVGTLAVHNPTPVQANAILAPLETAVKQTRERLEGKAANKPSFRLPE